MSYQKYALPDWLAHIERQHARSIDMQLARVAGVWKKFACARAKLVITVAGTNGKGSCVAMLEAVLRGAGMRVGAYTSPHLLKYNERVRVDGAEVCDDDLCDAFCAIESARGETPLTYFEFGTLCALLIFARAQTDAWILETGMGGRLDAVNIIDNDIALLTSVGIDHANWLGGSREQIAAEKAGVFKSGALAVCAEPHPPPCIARIAAVRDCTLLQSGKDFAMEMGEGGGIWRGMHEKFAAKWRRIENLHPPFAGAQQAENLSGVIAALALLREKIPLETDAMRAALAKSKLRARCQVFAGSPQVILDVAHNRDSAKTLAEFLSARAPSAAPTLAVTGMLADKAHAEIFAELRGVFAEWHLATLGGARGETAAALQRALAEIEPHAKTRLHASPLPAFRAARAAAGRGRVVVFGSFHTVGAILADLEREQPAGTA